VEDNPVDQAYLRAHPEHLPTFLTHQRIRETPVGGGSVSAASRLTLDDGTSVFAKTWPQGDPPADFYEAEAAGLRWLAEAGAPVPELIVGLPKMLATEWLDEASPTPASAERLGRDLAALHRSGASYDRFATAEQEIAEIRDVIDRLAGTVPELAGAGDALLTRLEEEAAAEPADPVVPAHHDFRPAQVLLYHGDVGFIDFDGAAMAEPALDLGRFRAKLRDIAISALAGPLTGPAAEENLRLQDDLCEHFLAAYREHAPVSGRRVRLWEACDLLTAMLHAWTKVRLARLEPRLVVLGHQLESSGLLGTAPPAPPAAAGPAVAQSV
jgi:aminoglycoside phosphotransferase (APT) family kinase protein